MSASGEKMSSVILLNSNQTHKNRSLNQYVKSVEFEINDNNNSTTSKNDIDIKKSSSNKQKNTTIVEENLNQPASSTSLPVSTINNKTSENNLKLIIEQLSTIEKKINLLNKKIQTQENKYKKLSNQTIKINENIEFVKNNPDLSFFKNKLEEISNYIKNPPKPIINITSPEKTVKKQVVERDKLGRISSITEIEEDSTINNSKNK